jgi:hypothetical protein
MFKLFRPEALPMTEPAPPANDRETAGGCGWFDSSHDLQSGLQVHEHTSLATLAELLPLSSWLELHLSGGPPGLRAQ